MTEKINATLQDTTYEKPFLADMDMFCDIVFAEGASKIDKRLTAAEEEEQEKLDEGDTGVGEE